MQAPAQGLGQLMQQRQQGAQPQQAMPSPQKASPMAGLGSVEDRVAAYRGNPAPLQQRYAMSQDMLDLLALQKIKSEKDAAARQMQMAMAQQQAAQGGEPPTIAQQREQEVRDLTKNELAQQIGATGQQQAQQQQQAMQRLMGGIARAPGAQAAAQPKMMATGGIVAFADGGGAEDPEVQRRIDDLMRRYPNLSQEQARRMAMQPQRPETLSQETRRLAAPEKAAVARREFAQKDPRRLGPTPKIESPFVQSSELTMDEPVAGGQPPVGRIPPRVMPTRPPVSDTYPDESRRGSATFTNPQASAQSRSMVPPPAQAMPEAPGVARPKLDATAPAAGLPGLVDKTASDMMRLDPRARQLEDEKRIAGLMGLDPVERAVYEKNIAERQRYFDETYDPEAMRRERLKRFLASAGGRRYNELGAGALASMDTAAKQREERTKDLATLQAARTKPIDIRRESTKSGIEGGLKGLEQLSLSQRAGLESGTRRVEGEADRGVKMYTADLQAEINRITKQGYADQRAMNSYTIAQEYLRKKEEDLQAVFDNEIGMLGLKLRSGKELKPEEQKVYDAAKTKFNLEVAKARKEMLPVLEAARAKFGISTKSGTSGWGQPKKLSQ